MLTTYNSAYVMGHLAETTEPPKSVFWPQRYDFYVAAFYLVFLGKSYTGLMINSTLNYDHEHIRR